MLVYTSVTKCYIPKARVLAKSVKKFHPDWEFQLLLSDNLPDDFDLNKEPFDGIVTIDQLGIPNWKSWAFGHTVVELCTAVKGIAGVLFAERPDVDKVMYLDPDIKVFNSLAPLDELLNKYEVLLTPHLLDAEESLDAIRDNEISALKHGIYNLGFYAARASGQGGQFINWWSDRLRYFCIDDIPGGLFTDQRWCDLAPGFFDKLHIIRDRGCNVATWNVAHRSLSVKNELFYAGDVPLRFYHFTGYDSGDGYGMLMRYASSQKVAMKLWEEYGEGLKNAGNSDSNLQSWKYGLFDNGTKIPFEARRLYRSRGDLKEAFPDPFSVIEPCFMSFWGAEEAAGRTDPSDSTESQKYKSSRRAKLKSALRVFRVEGISGVVRRIRYYANR